MNKTKLKLSGNYKTIAIETPVKETKTIDLTPTWIGVLPALLAVIQDGNNEGKKVARIELKRMAEAADSFNEQNKIIGNFVQFAIIPELTEILKTNKDEQEETEFYSYMDELLQILCLDDNEQIQQFIDGLSWENFRDDQDDTKFYTLGQMFFNKMQWTAEGSCKDFQSFVMKYIWFIPDYLDKIEKMAWTETK